MTLQVPAAAAGSSHTRPCAAWACCCRAPTPQPQQSLATVSLDCQPAEADAESSCCTSGCRPGGPAAAGDGEAAPACRAAAGAAATTISHLPLELLGCILEAVLEDDAAHERRPVVQFVGRQWLAAYRCAAYSRVAVDVGAALAGMEN